MMSKAQKGDLRQFFNPTASVALGIDFAGDGSFINL